MFIEQQIIILEWFLKDHVSNDAENSALITEINYIFTMFTQKTVNWNCNNISLFLLYFDQINAAWVSRRYFFQKPKKKTFDHLDLLTFNF